VTKLAEREMKTKAHRVAPRFNHRGHSAHHDRFPRSQRRLDALTTSAQSTAEVRLLDQSHQRHVLHVGCRLSRQFSSFVRDESGKTLRDFDTQKSRDSLKLFRHVHGERLTIYSFGAENHILLPPAVVCFRVAVRDRTFNESMVKVLLKPLTQQDLRTPERG